MKTLDIYPKEKLIEILENYGKEEPVIKRPFDDVFFEIRENAFDTVVKILDLAAKNPNHIVEINECYKFVTMPPNDNYANKYWSYNDLKKHTRIYRRNNGFYDVYAIYFPFPDTFTIAMAREVSYNKKFLEEENNMATTTNMNCTLAPVYSYKAKDEETLAYEEAKRKIQEEADKKIQKIMDDTAKKLEALENERFWARKKKGEADQAKYWKTRYDALIEAGFTDDQAWQMCMKSFEMD